MTNHELEELLEAQFQQARSLSKLLNMVIEEMEDTYKARIKDLEKRNAILEAVAFPHF